MATITFWHEEGSEGRYRQRPASTVERPSTIADSTILERRMRLEVAGQSVPVGFERRFDV